MDISIRQGNKDITVIDDAEIKWHLNTKEGDDLQEHHFGSICNKKNEKNEETNKEKKKK